MDDIHWLVAARIRSLAKERRVPLTHLADRAGVSRKQLWNVLNCITSPTLSWLAKIAAALEVDIIDLLQNGDEASHRTRERRS